MATPRHRPMTERSRADFARLNLQLTTQPCAVDGCDRTVAGRHGRGYAGYCSGHAKRKSRGLLVDVPLQERLSPAERLREAAIRYADADGDEEWGRAWKGLQGAADAFARRKG